VLPTRLLIVRVASACAFSALLFLAFSTANHAQGQSGVGGGPWPSVVGGGATSTFKFSFSANEGPSSARGAYGSAGHAKIDGVSNTTKIQGPVLCATIDVTTQQGWFVFQYDTDASGNALRARVYAKDVSDSGGGDTFGWDNDQATATCVQNPVDLTLHPAVVTIPANTSAVTKGNIVIDND
jgi:hypothetical protein